MPVLAADDVKNKDAVSQWVEELQARVNVDNIAVRFTLSVSKEEDENAFCVIKSEEKAHGVTTERSFTSEFFLSGEYKSFTKLGQELEGLVNDGAFVKRGEKQRPIFSFKQALNWLMDEAKRGQSIQRYKGLGEMNPEQLWETTLDANTRRLLRIQIEDAVAADEIFTTLMGDNVEPRRDFIEQNALSVSNIDI